MTVDTPKDGPMLFMPAMAIALAHPVNPKRVTRRLTSKHEAGDRIWCKESYRTLPTFDDFKPSEIPEGTVIGYAADGTVIGSDRGVTIAKLGKLRPSLFMCKWMSRIHLEVTDVRQERLHAITDDDALLEGIEAVRKPNGGVYYRVGDLQALTPVLLYSMLWDKANGAGSWDKNPMVFRIAFDRID